MNQLFFLITKAVVDRNQQTALSQHISLREKNIYDGSHSMVREKYSRQKRALVVYAFQTPHNKDV